MSIISLIPLFPLIGFLINGLSFRKGGIRQISKKNIGYIGVGASLASFVCTLVTYQKFHGTPIIENLFEWIRVGSFPINFSFQIDQLTLLMLFIITGIGTLIHVYSIGYMQHDEGYGKFMAFLNLFLFSMLLLVMGSNYIVMFIGWEGVGLCSYLLIGFWNTNTEYNNAARKAFIMNRIGDLGFLLGIFLIIKTFGSVEYLEVFKKAEVFAVGNPTIMAITLLLFVGAMGKSAQIPLYTWLPDAMAGPTPVSALIHAATMVTSGIYMIVRSNILYTLSPETLHFVAIIGLATAFLAATIGIFQNDIKKVLAYSTVSQLGYMFLALGVMAYTPAFFHVMTHAFFKALLFLGAGSVIHAMSGEQDIRRMGGLWKKIPITAWTFLIGTIAISGIPPFAGFFSKDDILAHVFEHSKIMWGIAVFTSMMTAFYMFRLFFLTFFGQFRGTHAQEHHLHESPASMTTPLGILAFLSIFGGLIGVPEVLGGSNHIAEYMAPLYEGSRKVYANFGAIQLSHSTEIMLMVLSVVAALVSLAIAYFIFVRKNTIPAEDNHLTGIQKTIYNKYYIDELYQTAFVNPTKRLSNVFANNIEKQGFGGLNTGISGFVDWAAAKVRLAQTGATGYYLFAMVIGIIIIFGINFGEIILGFLKLKH